MIKQDYLSRLIKEFSERVSISLDRALIKKDPQGVLDTEEAIGDLLELDPATVLVLEPESFALMVTLGGTGEVVASYIAYALQKVADAYGKDAHASANKEAQVNLQELASLRRAQAQALLASFGITEQSVPEELVKLDQAIKASE